MATPKFIYLDTTFLKFAGDLRGIPQVLFSLTEVCAEPEYRGKIRFICYPEAAAKYLYPQGILPEDVILVPEFPVLGRFERFHGLGSTRRYRKALKGTAAAILHPEPRSITRLKVHQTVIWYDLLQMQGARTAWRKLSRYLFLLYKYRLAAKAQGLAISEHTKREVTARYPSANPEDITVTWLGTRSGITGTPGSAGIVEPLECIYIGALEARKNVYEMLAHLDDIFGSRTFRLHLVGRLEPQQAERARAILEKAGRLDSVHFEGMLSDIDLKALMSRCDITLFPSLGEGFGLPVVEAMTHGHLVFAFRNTSITEVAGDAAVLAENSDFKAWGTALDSLIRDPEKAAALRQRAFERSRIFSDDAMKGRFREYLSKLVKNLLPEIPS